MTQQVGNLRRPHKPCRYCGRKHKFRKDACPAVDKQCYICNRKRHFATQCKSVKAHYIDNEYSDNKLLFIHTVKGLSSKPALATCIVNKRHKVTFEIDTGASCNILPFTDYVKQARNPDCPLQDPANYAQLHQCCTTWQSNATCGTRGQYTFIEILCNAITSDAHSGKPLE